jgi:hypothetical protein
MLGRWLMTGGTPLSARPIATCSGGKVLAWCAHARADRAPAEGWGQVHFPQS